MYSTKTIIILFYTYILYNFINRLITALINYNIIYLNEGYNYWK